MVCFQICCLHHPHLLFPVDLCSYYKGNPTEKRCKNLCYRSKSHAIYYNSKKSSCFTTFHPYCLRFSCYTLGKKIRGLRTALKRKEGITGRLPGGSFCCGELCCSAEEREGHTSSGKGQQGSVPWRICRFFHRTSCLCPFCLTALSQWSVVLSYDKV